MNNIKNISIIGDKNEGICYFVVYSNLTENKLEKALKKANKRYLAEGSYPSAKNVIWLASQMAGFDYDVCQVESDLFLIYSIKYRIEEFKNKQITFKRFEKIVRTAKPLSFKDFEYFKVLCLTQRWAKRMPKIEALHTIADAFNLAMHENGESFKVSYKPIVLDENGEVAAIKWRE